MKSSARLGERFFFLNMVRRDLTYFVVLIFYITLTAHFLLCPYVSLWCWCGRGLRLCILLAFCRFQSTSLTDSIFRVRSWKALSPWWCRQIFVLVTLSEAYSALLCSPIHSLTKELMAACGYSSAIRRQLEYGKTTAGHALRIPTSPRSLASHASTHRMQGGRGSRGVTYEG